MKLYDLVKICGVFTWKFDQNSYVITLLRKDLQNWENNEFKNKNVIKCTYSQWEKKIVHTQRKY